MTMKIPFFAKTCLLTLTMTSATVQAKSTARLPLDEIRNFVDVYNAIKNEYVEEKDGQTLIGFAIKGMLNELDPHSAYFKKDELDEFKENAEGSYQGFGIQLEVQGGQLIVISPLANSPAEKAGIKSLDKIIKINETVINNFSMQEVSNLLKDLPEVQLTIISNDGEPRNVKLKRSKIDLPSISEKILDKNYGYIRIAQFQDNTDVQFQTALEQYLNKKVKGLVIDLRNNPGGLLNAATSIADYFLEAGLIVSTKNLNMDSEEKIHAKKAQTLAPKLPLVNGDAIKLTTARYYTPNGQSIQAKGITPDIVLSQLKVTEENSDLLSYNEADISGHLKAETKTKDKSEAVKKTEKANEDKSAHSKEKIEEITSVQDKTSEEKAIQELSSETLAKEDLQLFEALNILKALTLTR